MLASSRCILQKPCENGAEANVFHKFPFQLMNMNNTTRNAQLFNNGQEITDGRGVDVAVEALGKALTFEQCTKSVRDGGKAVMIGLAATNVVGQIDITRLVRRQVSYILYNQSY